MKREQKFCIQTKKVSIKKKVYYKNKKKEVFKQKKSLNP
jgi:hypothetical protein